MSDNAKQKWKPGGRTGVKTPRQVFGRMRGIEGYDGYTFTLEMRKDGLHVRKRGSRNVEVVPFARLCNGAKFQVEVLCVQFNFCLGEKGVEVQTRKGKTIRVVPWAELVNMSRRQPVLFPMLEVAK